MDSFFEYGQKEIDYLKSRDKRLGAVIDQTGHIYRRVIPNLFAALVHSIIGQQISTKAHETIWKRMNEGIGAITPQTIDAMALEDLQKYGMTFKKVGYIKSTAHKILTGEFNIEKLSEMTDEEVCTELSKLDGIGTWTAEMLMIFSMQRPNIVSYKDLAIIRGMKRLYHHKEMTKERFERYRKRYSPYGSVASLYLWKIAGGQGELKL
ncbi:MAG: DNA-3-methyladenine glycosylase 2 family protein [Prevotella sp.]|nr:DNA-3-methyladenine glycosylase 2 family protein [Prevotella sp.]